MTGRDDPCHTSTDLVPCLSSTWCYGHCFVPLPSFYSSVKFLNKGGFTGVITCLPVFPHCFASSIQMKLEGKVRRLLGDEFQEKVPLIPTPSASPCLPHSSLLFQSVLIHWHFSLCSFYVELMCIVFVVGMPGLTHLHWLDFSAMPFFNSTYFCCRNWVFACLNRLMFKIIRTHHSNMQYMLTYHTPTRGIFNIPVTFFSHLFSFSL